MKPTGRNFSEVRQACWPGTWKKENPVPYAAPGYIRQKAACEKNQELSEAALKEMEEMVNKCCFKLPPFCHFTPEDWKEKGSEYDEIRDNMLGWDITDYGLGRFDEVGFSLITLRNGNLKTG